MPKPKTMKAGSPDNFQTDPTALNCLVPYLLPRWRIWEPACGNGNLVRGLIAYGHNELIASDIIGGHDFMTWIPEKSFDCIVTNPPFSIKEKFLSRCYQLGKPFALLMPLTTFDSVERRQLFAANGIGVIFPPGRVNFETPNHKANMAAGKKTSAWFYSAWFVHGLGMRSQLTFTDSKQLPGVK